MIAVRKSSDRGHADHGWLDSRHTFSFADYYDPQEMGWGTLRVINEDRVQTGQGFGTHGHRDMEIISYVLAGELQHMSAGTGVRHSEFNPSPSTPVHFLQIWIEPEAAGQAPSYEQKAFAPAEKRGRLRLVASRDGREGSVTVHQDADLYASLLSPGESVSRPIAPGRLAYLHLLRGGVHVNGVMLKTGDGAKVEGEPELAIAADEDSELLLFDLG